eukprot:5573870-Alexandrium_andersonii.AAC.1
MCIRDSTRGDTETDHSPQTVAFFSHFLALALASVKTCTHSQQRHGQPHAIALRTLCLLYTSDAADDM